MEMQKGEQFRSRITGKLYTLKTINNWMVELESEDGWSQLMTEARNLGIFYFKVSNDCQFDSESAKKEG